MQFTAYLSFVLDATDGVLVRPDGQADKHGELAHRVDFRSSVLLGTPLTMRRRLRAAECIVPSPPFHGRVVEIKPITRAIEELPAVRLGKFDENGDRLLPAADVDQRTHHDN